jgi:FKBP-type peptidyl-prolyl cis-trans isomerase 2
MNTARHGSTVTVHYIGTLDNGRIFDSADEANPLVFVIGADQVFPALERAVTGMRAGETKNVVIPASEAYGPRLAGNIVTVARTSFPPDRELRPGQRLRVEFGDTKERVMLVTEVGEDTVVLDANHPLAGLDLTFALRLDRVK